MPTPILPCPTTMSLSQCFILRFDRKGDRADVESGQASVTSTVAEHPDLPRRHRILAVAYVTRFRELGNMDDLESALKYHHAAVDATPADDPALLVRKTNLGASYFDRFARLGDKADIDAALQYDLSVLEAVASDDPELPR